jgi:protease I
MRIAILAADGVERIELEEPRGALYGAGALSDVLSLHGGEIQARQFDLRAFCPAIVEQFAARRVAH